MAARLARNRFLIAGLMIAAMVWPIDAVVESYRRPAIHFWASLLHPGTGDILSRGLLALLILALSLYVQWVMRRLQHEQERYALISRGINGGIWEWSPGTDAFQCSPQLLRDTLGLGDASPESMRMEPWMALIHADDRNRLRQALRDIAEGDLERYEEELRMRHRDGQWRYFRLRAFPVQQGHPGSAAHIVGTLADISERKRIEAQYLQKAEELTIMLATTTDGYWLVGEDSLILEANAAYGHMSGFSIDEIVGHTVSKFEVIETPEETAAHIRKVIATGFDRFETKHACKDGRIIDVEVSASFLEGKRQISCFFRDVTERKRTKEELLRLSRIVEQTSEGVMVVNRAGIIEYVNPAFCRNTGYSEGDAVGQKPSILKSGAQNDAFYNRMWNAISGGKSWTGSVVDRRKDGSFFPALLSIFPILDENGDNLYFVGIQRDISDLKRMEDQFLQAQKMEAIGTLVGGIAHDFNNVLAAIQAGTYLARIKLDNNPKEAADQLTDIDKLTNRGADMIKQMMAFARKDTIQRRSLSLTDFLVEGLSLARTAIPENIEFAYEAGEEELIIDGDPTQLQQVIMNLLNNARDAVAGMDGPRINCSLAAFAPGDAWLKKHGLGKGGRFAHLCISDNGMGISEEHRDKIFEPFYTTKGVGKGTGLGLAMVHGVIESHGGVMEVESIPGRGAAFHLYLPLQRVSAMATEMKDTGVVEGRGEIILLVDDEASVRNATSAVLDSLGYRVRIAVDGIDAVSLLEREPQVSLIVTDVVMPRMGGMALAEALRQSGNLIPILFATGYDREQSIGEERHIPHSDVIRKPFSPSEISRAVRRLIDAAASGRP